MEDEELKRAIDSLLKSLATFKARVEQFKTNLSAGNERVDMTLDETIARTDKQIAQTNVRLERLAEAYEEFIQVMTRVWESQRKLI